MSVGDDHTLERARCSLHDRGLVVSAKMKSVTSSWIHATSISAHRVWLLIYVEEGTQMISFDSQISFGPFVGIKLGGSFIPNG